ncbi:MAG TPA: hypothetical protein PLN54_12540 [Flavobacteriales bacterium]|nr:hypothetical protein [Flavobacteriales bacterium]
MNTNWAKILLFSLLSFALGVILCLLLCGRCGGGACGQGGHCGRESACMHGGHGHGHGGACGGACMGQCGGACKGACGGATGAACCKGGGHGEGPAHGIVKQLEAAGFQGDTTIAIEGGTVNVKRTGERTEVRVEMEKTVDETTAQPAP